MQRGDPLQNSQNGRFFLAEVQKLQKIGNTGPILASLVCMDAEFILVSNDTKRAKK